MEPITKETFNEWLKQNNWLQIAETATPDGRQLTFLTPSGSLILVMYDLKGNLNKVGQLMPVSPASMPSPNILRGFMPGNS